MSYIPPNPNGQATSANSAPVVIASDQSTIPIRETPQTSGGLLTSKTIAAASTNATSIKASAGQLYGWQIVNNASSVRYVKFYNKASAPTVGTDVPVFTLGLAANTSANVLNSIGIAYSTGIAIAITAGIADNDTTAVSANDLVVNIFYF